MKNDIIVQVKDLKKNYQSKIALNNLSFELNENSITGLIGRNGSGKTTLMKILGGQLDYTSGIATVLSEKPMDNLSVLPHIIYSYHNFAYQRNLTLEAILMNYNTLFPKFDLSFAKKLIKYFELSPNMKYKNLSQGMGSIFNFICALSSRCKLTMFDEPVLGMDITVRRAAYEVLLRDYAQNPRTFIISSHLFQEMESVLSDILLIEQGELLLHKNIDDFRNSAYRIDGESSIIEDYMQTKNVLKYQNSPLQSYAIIYEDFSPALQYHIKELGLTVSAVSSEDLCIYLTKQNKEEALACLW